MRWTETVSREVAQVLMEQYSSVADALFELVDNPIDLRRGKRLAISVSIDKARDTIVVEDHGGAGMGAADVAQWLSWGRGRDRRPTDISRWRVGGKAACGYLGDRLVLYAKASGSDDVWFLEDEGWASRSEAADWGEPEPLPKTVPLPASLEDRPVAEGYVRIEISKLRPRIYNVEDLRWELSNTYRALLERADIAIEINGEAVAPLALPRSSAFADVTVDLRTVEDHRVRGWIGRLDRDSVVGPSARRRIQGGIRCVYQGRLVRTGEYFGHAGDAKGSLASLIGEIELAFVPPNLTKTDFDRGSPEWAGLEAVMRPFLAPIIRTFQKAGEAGRPSKQERSRLRSVCDELEEAFRLLQQSRTGFGQAGIPENNAERGDLPADPPVQGYGGRLGGRSKNEDARTKVIVERESETARGQDTARKPTPAPPEHEAVGRLVRLLRQITGGGLRPQAQLDSFDSAFRSRLRTEAGKTSVVVNTAYPGYAEFKASPGYLAETVIMKLAEPVEGERRSVSDYVAEVTNVLAMWARLHQGSHPR